MRTIIFILLLSPILSLAQKNEVLIKLTDAGGKTIKGDCLLRGFENCISATTINSAGKDNTLVSFTMTVNGSAADLKKAATNGELLLNGLVTVLAPVQSPGRPITAYTIKMENISVLSCNETMGCNSVMNTTVSLQATRIGWTYYNPTTSGAQTVSRKYGWDADSKTEWTKF